MLALETPMCVGRVRDVFYNNGFVPYELTSGNTNGAVENSKTVSVTQIFEDGDGTEATAGERTWTGSYFGELTQTCSLVRRLTNAPAART